MDLVSLPSTSIGTPNSSLPQYNSQHHPDHDYISAPIPKEEQLENAQIEIKKSEKERVRLCKIGDIWYPMVLPGFCEDQFLHWIPKL